MVGMGERVVAGRVKINTVLHGNITTQNRHVRSHRQV